MNTTTNQEIKNLQQQAPDDVKKVLDIALYLIYLAKKNDKDMNSSKLHRLLYYCQAWSLAQNNRKMFDNEIEAWVHGGVVSDLYFYMRSSIDVQEIEEEINTSDINNILDKNDKKMIERVFEVYGGYSGVDLEIRNHQEIAWQKARAKLDRGLLGRPEIDTKLMKTIDRMKEYEAT